MFVSSDGLNKSGLPALILYIPEEIVSSVRGSVA